MSSTLSIISASVERSSGRHGAKVTPQFPITTLVTPCQQLEVPIGSQASCASRWVWMSTKPGVTSRPSASISRAPVPSIPPSSEPMISAIRSALMPTSARVAGAPVPSMTVPLRMMMSWFMAASNEFA